MKRELSGRAGKKKKNSLSGAEHTGTGEERLALVSSYRSGNALSAHLIAQSTRRAGGKKRTRWVGGWASSSGDHCPSALRFSSRSRFAILRRTRWSLSQLSLGDISSPSQGPLASREGLSSHPRQHGSRLDLHKLVLGLKGCIPPLAFPHSFYI